MTEILSRLTTAVADRYEVEREFGAGGMATVYLARDARHHREVAIKVLRPELAAVIGAERFLREIEIAAALHHPHILPLYDSGQADGLLFYVMPYIEGESLRRRLQRETQLPIEEALQITRHVAAALDYAHRHGIVHRDIKPENILLHEGEALVADFGIALAIRAAGGERLTETGLSLGTPHYMSPEQATGERQVDARSDVYSLGCVLYEMLAGQPPHTGPTAQAIVAQLLTTRAPDVRALRDAVPPVVADAVAKALGKLPADRFASAAEFGAAIGQATTAAAPAAISARDAIAALVASVVRSRWLKSVAPWAVAGLAAFGALAGWLRPSTLEPPRRFTVLLPSEQRLDLLHNGTVLALSPNGRYLVYVGTGQPGRQLWLRGIDQLQARPIAGTEDARHPFFSPDGAWIGFWAQNKIKKVALAGGPPLTITDAPTMRGASWGPGDVILFANLNGPLLRVAAAGGAVDTVTQLDTARAETWHRWPEIMPGGRAALFTIQASGADGYQVGVVSLETGEVKHLLSRATHARYVPTGHLVYASAGGAMLAVPFAPRRLAVTGSPVSLLEGLLVRPSGAAEFAVGGDGSMIYLSGAPPEQELVLVDRQGGERALTGKLKSPQGPRFSPDGRRVALTLTDGAAQDVWIHDVSQGTLSRLTFEGQNFYPAWSPDGRKVAYSSTAAGRDRDIYWKAWDGSGAEDTLVARPEEQWEVAFAPDGRSLVYRESHPKTARDIWFLPLQGDRTPQPLLTTPFEERAPSVSPDGRWLAYTSEETGREEVYVRPYPGAGGRWQVSTGGGQEPLWARTGRELFYRSGDSLIAVDVRPGPVFSVGSRRRLFQGRYAANNNYPNYDVHPDGRRFLMIKSQEGPSELVAVLGWFEELRRRTSPAAKEQ